jgi:Group II intron, maturase-specific domain
MLGWRGYFGFCETPEVLIALTRWVRLRLRAAVIAIAARMLEGGAPGVEMTETPRRTRSTTSSDMRSYRPSSQR